MTAQERKAVYLPELPREAAGVFLIKALPISFTPSNEVSGSSWARRIRRSVRNCPRPMPL